MTQENFLNFIFKTNAFREFIICNGASYTYGELIQKIDFWHSRIKSDGVVVGSRVLLKGDYSFEWVSLFLALVLEKAVVIPFSIENLDSMQIEIVRPQFFYQLEKDSLNFFCKNERSFDHPLLKNLRERQLPGLIIFSSGTTGIPKAILHDFSKFLEKFKIPKRRYRTLLFLPSDHLGGINTLFYALSNAGVLIVPSRRMPSEVCSLIHRYQVELLPTTPSFLNLLLVSGEYLKHDLTSIKRISYGSEVMSQSTLKKLQEIFPKVELQQTYGLSEVGALRTKSKENGSLLVKVGGEGFETKIVDGVLKIKTSNAMLGYLNYSQPFDEEGWMDTGDMVVVEGEYLRILGRKSDVINVGGNKVFPIEVENVLMNMEGVAEVTVQGEANALLGQTVMATIRLLTEEDPFQFYQRMTQYCLNSIPKYKIPVRINLVKKDLINSRFKKTKELFI